MVVVMKADSTDEQIKHVVDKLHQAGLEAHVSKGIYKTVIGAIGDEELVIGLPLTAMPGVEGVFPIMKPYKLASREFRREDTVVSVGEANIGDGSFTIMAGPCAVESIEQVRASAEAVKKSGCKLLRGGAFKPRSSTYSFQGLGEEGLKILADAGKDFGLPILTEVMDTRDVEIVAEYADVIQIGARNMQNFQLLKEVGKLRKPVLLKRGFGATIEELLLSAEYVLREGNSQLILCERGIRTFETATRNTMDLSAIPVLKNLSHLPVVVDPSHGAGKSWLVPPLTRASLAIGADGALIEVHPNPEEALCDGPQALTFEQFNSMDADLRAIAQAMGRSL